MTVIRACLGQHWCVLSTISVLRLPLNLARSFDGFASSSLMNPVAPVTVKKRDPLIEIVR